MIPTSVCKAISIFRGCPLQPPFSHAATARSSCLTLEPRVLPLPPPRSLHISTWSKDRDTHLKNHVWAWVEKSMPDRIENGIKRENALFLFRLKHASPHYTGVRLLVLPSWDANQAKVPSIKKGLRIVMESVSLI